MKTIFKIIKADNEHLMVAELEQHIEEGWSLAGNLSPCQGRGGDIAFVQLVAREVGTDFNFESIGKEAARAIAHRWIKQSDAVSKYIWFTLSPDEQTDVGLSLTSPRPDVSRIICGRMNRLLHDLYFFNQQRAIKDGPNAPKSQPGDNLKNVGKFVRALLDETYAGELDLSKQAPAPTPMAQQ